ncbi:MAG: hypothetical protein ABJF23_12835 [Bryobacteraceae bacterium]
MRRQILQGFAVCATLASAVYGQTYQRQASIRGGGNPDHGKCTIEVVVDGAAQVEIRGSSATLRNLSGRPAQWRRFECNTAMPVNPSNFRAEGIDGRGRQTLIRDPQNGGVAIVQIEDKDSGSEGYTFDVLWDTRGYNQGPISGNGPDYRDQNRNRQDDRNRQNDRYRDDDHYRGNSRDGAYYRQYGHGFAKEEAVRVCQDEVTRQATARFRGVRDIHFLNTRIDDNPGREDWVMGSVDLHRGPRGEIYNFSCSVNFDNGRVRTAQLDSRPTSIDRR